MTRYTAVKLDAAVVTRLRRRAAQLSAHRSVRVTLSQALGEALDATELWVAPADEAGGS